MANEHHHDRRHIVAKIIAKAWSNPAFKRKLLKDPVTVLREAGMDVPDGLQIQMHADTKKLEHGVIPAPPAKLSKAQRKDPKNVHIVYCFTAFHTIQALRDEAKPVQGPG